MIDYKGVVVREENGFKEAIHIKRKVSDLNKDKGRLPTTISLWLYFIIWPINNFRSDDPVFRQFQHQHQ